jgi:tetratricopeptide (TPR) repeat protein
MIFSSTIYPVDMRSNSSVLIIAVLALCIVAVYPVAAASNEAVALVATAQSLTAQGNLSAAEQAYDQAITLDPDYAEAWDGRADILNRAHKDTADPLATLNLALAASNRSLEINESSVKAWINHGQILYNIGYYYQDQLNDKTTANAYYNEQLASFEKAIALEPDNAEAWFNKAYALCGMGRCSEGVTAFKKVQQLEPDYPYLEGNLKNAEKLADSQTPVYIKYGLDIALVVIVIIGAVLWYVAIRKKN